MRLFTGIALPPNVLEKLTLLLEELRPTVAINRSKPENLHITTKFIGGWDETRLAQLTTALATVTEAAPIAIKISRLGFFPNPHHPHSLFAGVQPAPGLAALATAIDQALIPLGINPETRDYRPHVTLARIKSNADIGPLREHIAAMTDFDFGAFEAASFHLYRSDPTPAGSVYTKLATYDLMRENKKIR